MNKERGFFAIGVYNPKTEINIGTLWRSAFLLGANWIFIIGKRYKHQRSDTMKAYKHIPLHCYDNFDDFYHSMPLYTSLIGVELTEDAIPLMSYKHSERSIYLLGSEDNGLPEDILVKCVEVIKIDMVNSLNVSVMGSIVMYDRISKMNNK